MTRSRVLVLLASLVLPLATRTPAYELQYLPELPGTTKSQAAAINERLQIVGWCDVGSTMQRHAVLWDEDGVRDIGLLPGYAEAEATDVNNRGQVVGYCSTHPGPLYQASFIWDKRSGMQQIPTPEGCILSRAAAINGAGQVAALCAMQDPAYHEVAYRWSYSEGIVPLEPVPGEQSTYNQPYDINDAGTVVGTMDFFVWTRPSYSACLWGRNGAANPLPTNRESHWAGSGQVVTAVNNQGTCVGFDYTMIYIFFRPNAVVWDAHGGLHWLPQVLPQSAASDINDRGDIVGYVQTETYVWPLFGPGKKWAVLWDHTGCITIFSPPGSASAINNAGVIVGEVDGHAVVWR